MGYSLELGNRWGPAMTKSGKSENCWQCGFRLDQAYQGRNPEKHDCGEGGCVVCPKCSSPLCEYDGSKADKANKMKEQIRAGAVSKPVRSRDKAPPRTLSLPAVDPFPLWVLPQRLQVYVTQTAKAFGCPADSVAVPMFAIAGAAIGTTSEIKVKHTYRQSPSIYAGVVGLPGSGKSPVLAFVSRPLAERQQQLLKTFLKEWRAYKSEKEFAEAARGTAEGSASPPAAAESPDGEDSDDCMMDFDLSATRGRRQPRLKRAVTSDVTVEALVSILAHNPRGLAIIRDELIAWVKGMDMYRGRGNDRQFFQTAWSVAPYYLDRKGNQNGAPVLIAKLFLCICGGLNPDMLGELLDEAGRDDGFLDRLLLVYPDEDDYVPWSEEVVALEVEEGWTDALDELWALEHENKEGRLDAQTVRMSPGAKRIWVEFHNRLGQEAAGNDFPRHLRGTWSKLKINGARLTLILHELRVACGECADEECADEVSAQGAVALVDYFKTHALRVRALIGSGQVLAEGKGALITAIAQLVGEHGGRWHGTSSELLEGLRRSRGESGEVDWLPERPESMGRAVRRLAAALENEKRIHVELPGPTDKTRRLLLTKLPDPPKPPDGAASPAGKDSCASGGSPTPPPAAAPTAQPDGGTRAVPSAPPKPDAEPPTQQPPASPQVTDQSGGSGGLGGTSGDAGGTPSPSLPGDGVPATEPGAGNPSPQDPGKPPAIRPEGTPPSAGSNDQADHQTDEWGEV